MCALSIMCIIHYTLPSVAVEMRGAQAEIDMGPDFLILRSLQSWADLDSD